MKRSGNASAPEKLRFGFYFHFCRCSKWDKIELFFSKEIWSTSVWPRRDWWSRVCPWGAGGDINDRRSGHHSTILRVPLVSEFWVTARLPLLTAIIYCTKAIIFDIKFHLCSPSSFINTPRRVSLTLYDIYILIIYLHNPAACFAISHGL